VPARLRDLIRELEKHGVRIERPHGGSHWKFFSQAGVMYPLSAHNGPREEIPDLYIRKLCRALGIDYETLKTGL